MALSLCLYRGFQSRLDRKWRERALGAGRGIGPKMPIHCSDTVSACARYLFDSRLLEGLETFELLDETNKARFGGQGGDSLFALGDLDLPILYFYAQVNLS